jgi:hypothetical protein
VAFSFSVPISFAALAQRTSAGMLVDCRGD